MTCRCGHDGDGPHPCHAGQYTCRRPAKERFYNPELAPLSGVQMKLQMTQTWACDECWAKMEELLRCRNRI